MTIKQLAEAFGLSTEQFFVNGYQRFGMLYSIGGPKETHDRYLKHGCIPIYVARYAKEMQKLLDKHHATIN